MTARSVRRPHPQQDAILGLLNQGLSNAEISRRLHVGPRAAARVREEAGIAPAPRSSWNRLPHPAERQILTLLADGLTDAEIGRRTGADVTTIARRRKERGLGPATDTSRSWRSTAPTPSRSRSRTTRPTRSPPLSPARAAPASAWTDSDQPARDSGTFPTEIV